MSVCTFFGARDCPERIYGDVFAAIEELIIAGKAKTFFVGGEGNFDRIVQRALFAAKEKYPETECLIILAYLPGKKDPDELPLLFETIYPEGLENSPRRFAIDRRNKWMTEKAEYVIAYPSFFGNSAKMLEYAKKRGKEIIDLRNKK